MQETEGGGGFLLDAGRAPRHSEPFDSGWVTLW